LSLVRSSTGQCFKHARLDVEACYTFRPAIRDGAPLLGSMFLAAQGLFP
jgi:hypothetical protein